VARGWVGALGLSEVSAPTLRRAHAVFPIAAVQSEYSLWTRNPEVAVLQACRELGAAFVAFSPLARAFLTDTLHDVSTLGAKDIRRGMPRFEAATYAANLRLLPALRQLAQEAGCTPAQLALAWVLAQGEHVFAIPGTSQVQHLEENLGADALRLSPDQLLRLGQVINSDTVQGHRYSATTRTEIDSEEV
jgi:aryl-alcohol dehydrogenase-like predicted oxidoreductase